MLYAQVDDKNKVINVILADASFISKQAGCWIKACNQGCNPKNRPSKGYTWVPALNCFLPPRPSIYHELDSSSCAWKPKKRYQPLSGPPVPGEYTLELRDANGKRIYEIIEEGPHKSDRRKITTVITGILLDIRE